MGLDLDRVECTEWLGAVMEKLRAGDGKAKVVIKPFERGNSREWGVAFPITHYLLPVLRIRIELSTENADPDPARAFHFNADPDPAPQSDGNLRPLVCKPS